MAGMRGPARHALQPGMPVRPAKCAGHFEYLRRLKFEYECKIEEYEEEINRGDQSGISQ